MMLNDISIPSKALEGYCHKYHIRKLAFFGSLLRNDFGPESDIDVLVEFEAGHIPGFDFFLMEAELSRLLDRKVDLQTVNFLSPEIRRQALNDAVTAYEQA